MTVTVTKTSFGSPSYGAGGIRLRAPLRSVLAHEIAHAVHDSGAVVLANRIWEEGMARAAEVEVMRLLAQQGILESGYDYVRDYGYDRYYDNLNRRDDVGAPNGNIYGEPGIQLLRYELAGYAFGKIVIENPRFIAKMNAELFARSDQNFTQGDLVAMAALVQPRVEGQATSDWVAGQGIFEISPAGGCRLLQRVNQFTVDFFCRHNGLEVIQAGSPVSLTIYDWRGNAVFAGSDTTSPYGWVAFTPRIDASMGRLRMVASATGPDGEVTSTYYRQAGPEEGVFGALTNADNGTLTFSSPTESFPAFSASVGSGTFSAPSLSSVRGQVHVAYSGPTGTADRIITKDASPYSILITAQASPPVQAVPPVTSPPNLPPQSAPLKAGQPDRAGNLNTTVGALERPPRAGRLIIRGRAKVSTYGRKSLRRKLRVLVLLSNGRPAAGVNVKWAVPVGWGRFRGQRGLATTRTNPNGVAASPKLIAGRKIGRVAVTAAAVGYGKVKFTLTVKRPWRNRAGAFRGAAGSYPPLR